MANKSKHSLVYFALALIMIFCTISARASLVDPNFVLDERINGNSGISQPIPALTASFTDISASIVELNLDLTNLSGNEFVSNWYFNFDPALNLSLLQLDGNTPAGITM